MYAHCGETTTYFIKTHTPYVVDCPLHEIVAMSAAPVDAEALSVLVPCKASKREGAHWVR